MSIVEQQYGHSLVVTAFSSQVFVFNFCNLFIPLINKNTAKILLNWLEKWEIPYDEIIYGKPWPGHKGFYVDDRSVRPDEFLKYSVEELNEICNKSKEASK